MRQDKTAAAVCFRRRGEGVEFLLVRTRDRGRWTFPKGHLEQGESPSDAACREAAEEAGVSGRLDPQPVATYVPSPKSRGGGVSAYLLEYESQDSVPEQGREPTWFSAEEAVQKLAENRKTRHAEEHRRVVEAALARLR